MKAVTWLDQNGYKHRSLVKDSDDESVARYGIPCDPPDIEEIDWFAFKRELNNILVDNNIITWSDFQKNTAGVSSAISLFKRYLVGIYRIKEQEEKQATKIMEDNNG